MALDLNSTSQQQATDDMQRASYAAPLGGPNATQDQSQTPTPNASEQGQTPDDMNKPAEAAGQGQPNQSGQNPSGSQTQPQTQGQLPQTKPQAAISASDNPNSPQNHAGVRIGGWINATARALAGGDQYHTVIDANTGETKHVPVPLSTKQIGMAIAVAALTGGAAGLEQRGPGSEGRAVAAGFSQVVQQRQQQQKEEAQQASQDYARKAQITQTNFMTHQNALRLSQMDYDMHKQFVGDSKPVLDNINAVGATIGAGVRESELLDKYHVTKDMAIPDGIVENGKNPDGSTHYENTYTVVDPNAKIELPKETAQLLADLRVPGYFTMQDGKAVARNFAGSAPIKAALVVNGLALAQSYKITEGQINNQFKQLGKNGEKDATQFDFNLKEAVKAGSISAKGLQTIARYANVPFDQAVAAMEKDKVDPALIQQYRQVIPADAIEQSKIQRASLEAEQKKRDRLSVVDSLNIANAVLSDKSSSPEQVAAAKAFITRDRQNSVSKSAGEAYAGEAARLRAKGDYNGAGGALPGTVNREMVNNPSLKDVKPTGQIDKNGSDAGYLQQLTSVDPGLAAEVKAIGEGRNSMSKYGLAKGDGQRLAAMVHLAYPGYNSSKVADYEKTQTDLSPSGRLGRTYIAGSTAIEHLGKLFDSIGVGSTLGQSGTFATNVDNAADETASFYSDGYKANKDTIEHYRNTFNSHNPVKARDAVRQQANNMLDKIEESYNGQVAALPSSFIKTQPPLSVHAAQVFHKLTGKEVPSYLINHDVQSRIEGTGGFGTNASTQAAHAPYTPPTGAFAGRDGQGNIVQYKLADGSIVDAKTGQSVTQ